MVVKGKGTSPKSPKHSGLGMILICPDTMIHLCLSSFFVKKATKRCIQKTSKITDSSLGIGWFLFELKKLPQV